MPAIKREREREREIGINIYKLISQRKEAGLTPDNCSPSDDNGTRGSRTVTWQDSWVLNRLCPIGVYAFSRVAVISKTDSLRCVSVGLIGFDSTLLRSTGV